MLIIHAHITKIFCFIFQCTNVVTANDAAAIAIQLFRLDARLCDQHPMKVARTTSNPSVSGNSLHEATTSLACCSSNAQDIQRLSHDASVQTNPCTVFQVNPVHTTDLTKSLSDAQITQTASTCSQTDSESSSSSFKIINVESLTKEHKNQSIAPESMAQKQDDISAHISKENITEDVLTHIDNNIKPCEQNGTTDPINNDILNCLNVASLSIPDSLLNDLPTFMDTMQQPLKHIASYQTGNFIIFSFNNSLIYIYIRNYL